MSGAYVPPNNELKLSGVKGLPLMFEGLQSQGSDENYREKVCIYKDHDNEEHCEDYHSMDNDNIATGAMISEYRRSRHITDASECASQQSFARLCLKRARAQSPKRSVRQCVEHFTPSGMLSMMKLNIGGVRFHVEREVLLQFPMTIFHLLDSEQFLVDKDEQDYIFFDRDPRPFREILSLLRERQHQLAGGWHNCYHSQQGKLYTESFFKLSPFGRKQVIDDAVFYGLNGLIGELFTRRYQWRQCVFMQASSYDHMENVLEPSVSLPLGLPKGCSFATSVFLCNNIYLFGSCVDKETTFSLLYRLQLNDISAHELVLQDQSEDNIANHMEPTSAGMQRISYTLIQPFVQRGRETEVLPNARLGYAMVALNDLYILLFYGNDFHRQLNDVWAYHTVNNTWIPLRMSGDLVEGRSGHTVTVVQGRVYLIGGRRPFTSDGCVFTEVFEGRFNESEMELVWRLVFWPQRQGDERGQLHILSNETRAATTAEWRELAPCDVPPMAYHAAVDYKERYIVMFGGISAFIGPNQGGDGGWNGVSHINRLAHNTPICLYRFDTFSAKWCRLHTLIDPSGLTWSDIPISGHIAMRCNNEIYVMGSYERHQQLALFHFSLQTLMWRRIRTTVAPRHHPPCGREIPSGVLILPTGDNRHPVILLYGGYDVANRHHLNDAYILAL